MINLIIESGRLDRTPWRSRDLEVVSKQEQNSSLSCEVVQTCFVESTIEPASFAKGYPHGETKENTP